MDLGATLRSLSTLADATTRRATLDALARQLGARAVLIAVPDTAQPSRLIAAPGTPELPAGSGWRDMLDACKTPGVYERMLTSPLDTDVIPAIGYAYPQLAVIVVGQARAHAELADALASIAPLVAALFRSEQQAAGARRQALARVAHELREPLEPIATAVQMLRLDDTHSRIHDILARQVDHLIRLVDDLVTEGSGNDRIAMSPDRGRSGRGAVLVVDDNRDAADLLAALLDSLGYTVRVAHTGPDGLAAVTDFTPDIAVLDIGLPGMDGYQLARALHERLPALPLIAITGYGQDKDRARALDAGFAAHLVKPVSIGSLSELLHRLMPAR